MVDVPVRRPARDREEPQPQRVVGRPFVQVVEGCAVTRLEGFVRRPARRRSEVHRPCCSWSSSDAPSTDPDRRGSKVPRRSGTQACSRASGRVGARAQRPDRPGTGTMAIRCQRGDARAVSTPDIPAGAIVVGVDGSAPSEHAVVWATEVAARENRPLVLVHAAHLAGPWFAGAEVDLDALNLETMRSGQRLIGRTKDAVGARDRSVIVSGACVAEDARDLLIDLSRHAHLVVLGSRGRGGCGAWCWDRSRRRSSAGALSGRSRSRGTGPTRQPWRRRRGRRFRAVDPRAGPRLSRRFVARRATHRGALPLGGHGRRRAPALDLRLSTRTTPARTSRAEREPRRAARDVPGRRSQGRARPRLGGGCPRR